MNCDDFTQWLQTGLDERRDLRMPRDVRRHYNECDSCRGQMEAWNQISAILPGESPIPTQSNLHRQRIAAISGIVSAIAAVWIVSFFIGQQENPRTIAQVTPPTPAKLSSMDTMVSEGTTVSESTVGRSRGHRFEPLVVISVDDQDKVGPAAWWGRLQNRDWIDRTMPAVQSVRDGVAPLGRSFVRAVTILTSGSSVKG